MASSAAYPPVKVRDVLNELKWRPGRSLAKAELWVADRRGGIKVLPGADIVRLDRSSFETETATIPYYKVLRVVHEGEVVFEREEGR
jgi:uncharacterized protein (UPF0248 family)